MKKIFKLAAIAVSMALVASLVACSSGDDDVVDASTPEYLVAAQIGKYVASIKYEQNVSDDEIKSLKTVHEDVMKIIDDGCADCLGKYFGKLKSCTSYYDEDETLLLLDSAKIESSKNKLKELKSYYGTKEKFHEACVYKPAIRNAMEEVYKAGQKVVLIGNPEGGTINTILEGKLNDRQVANMKAATDAVAALKAALNKGDSKTCKTTIDAADKAIEAFGKLENKNVTKAEIKKVTDKVDEMYNDIYTNVYFNLLNEKY